MNTKLLPPVLEGTLPAFTGTTITVPFAMNRAVSLSEVSGIELKIKTVQNDMFVATVSSTEIITINGSSCKAVFDFSDIATLQLGASYKFQIAYIANDSTIGYYSTVGVAKYTTKPEVTIEGFNANQSNNTQAVYYGKYSQKGKDQTEKVYSYVFDLYDSTGNLVETSGEMLHMGLNDIVPYETLVSYKVNKGLEENKIYFIQFTVNTMNNLTISSPRYRIMESNLIKADIQAELCARNDFENGFIELYLKPSLNIKYSGSYEISRKDKHTGWQVLHRFMLNSEKIDTWRYRDFTVEQGEEYEYSLRQYSEENSVYSARILLSTIYSYEEDKEIKGNSIVADYEDMFLYDGERQLRIKFNPKVSSFKTTLLESKNDTIGSKYPTFFRNGRTAYKDFPISGLLSYWSDTDQLYLDYNDLDIHTDKNKRFSYKISHKPFDDNEKYYAKKGLEYIPVILDRNTYEFDKYYIRYSTVDLSKLMTTNLVGYNFYGERKFKLNVLDWLNNGKVKLFKSPGEGNYIVRLMNNSLSPIDAVGRMLHSFSSNAYEVSDYSLNNLSSFGIINSDSAEVKYALYLTSYDIEANSDNELLFMIRDQKKMALELKGNYTYVEFSDCVPGTKVYINNNKFSIGTTGTLHIDLPTGISTIKLNETSLEDIIEDYEKNPGNYTHYGQVIVGEYGAVKSEIFNRFKAIHLKDYILKQILGSGCWYNDNRIFDILYTVSQYNNFPLIDDVNKINHFYQMKFKKREVKEVYYFGKFPESGDTTDLEKELLDEGKLYYSYYGDKNELKGKEEDKVTEWDDWSLYLFRTPKYPEFVDDIPQDIVEEQYRNTAYYFDRNLNAYLPIHDLIYDAKHKMWIRNDDRLYKFSIHDEVYFDLIDDIEYQIEDIDINEIDYIKMGNGVMVDLLYSGMEIEYSALSDLYWRWKEEEEKFFNGLSTIEQVEKCYKDYSIAASNYLTQLQNNTDIPIKE